MPAPAAVIELVEKFDQHLKEYHAGKYNETTLRRDFLDPFFAALGWDVFNQKNYSERYREVMHEASVEVEGQARAADYAFRAGDKTIFFVEAKKPQVNIGTNPEPAFQIRRYGWSARLPVNLLTDFEQLAVYDCRSKPAVTEAASKGRVRLYHYKEYVEKWDEIAALFSHEAVLQGAFDRFAESETSKKGTTEVDDAFLAEIERWRDLLARNIALRNTDKLIRDERDLNYAVQMTIDRIIFLRICEDRGIEPDGQLHEIAKGADVYAELLRLFRRADTRYNSGLFHFEGDKITPGLEIDDKVFKDILHNLYYPESPYVFNLIPADILGQVYEQFLGKVIRLTAGHQAKVEEKPEVRKAGGVYYTPTYIVDYIVKNTVGKLFEGKTPKEVSRLKILDPACGSGSFLLGAYQNLLDWHLHWYSTNEPEKWAKGSTPAIYQVSLPSPAGSPTGGLRTGAGGEGWRLTTEEKKRILLNNLHGVDIDPQAVEVTKLSLLLKVLEGEGGQLSLGIERLLPDLSSNIQCGNSLIGPDYYEGRMFVDEAERYRVNAFNWKAAFPQVFTAGGFDVVIGNPPYIRIQAMQEWAPTEVEFYKVAYTAASKGNYDIYVVFVEKGLSLLNPHGRLGFILPHKFFNAQYGEPLRSLISHGKHLAKVVHFSDQQIFENATTYTCLMFLDKLGPSKFEFEKVVDLHDWLQSEKSENGRIDASTVTHQEWNFSVGKGSDLFGKLKQMPIKLGDVAKRIAQGIRTSANEIYVLDIVTESKATIIAHSKQLDKNVKIDRQSANLFLQGREIKAYRILPSGKVVIIPYSSQGNHMILVDEEDLAAKWPNTYEYLVKNKRDLENREHARMHGPNWYAYIYPKNLDVMKAPKILVPDIADRASFALDEFGEYAFTSGYAITLNENIRESIKYILGLLNSKLLTFYLLHITTHLQNGFFRYFTQFIEPLPIRLIDFSDKLDKGRHDRLVSLVDRMLALHKQEARNPQEQERLRREIEETDRSIDALVYELYGLTEEEIKIVEGRS